MKKSKYRMFWFGIAELIAGLALVVCSFTDVLKDSFWNGMGTALATMGFIFLMRGIRYRRDESYKEEVDTEANDERNKFLSMKAWSWAGYLYVMIAAVACIVLRVVKLNEYSQLLAYTICAIMVLYWIMYLIVRKKY